MPVGERVDRVNRFAALPFFDRCLALKRHIGAKLDECVGASLSTASNASVSWQAVISAVARGLGA